MIKHQSLRGIKAELTDWLDEDVVKYVRRLNYGGLSYEMIAAKLRESGFHVTGKQLSGWVYQSKKKAK